MNLRILAATAALSVAMTSATGFAQLQPTQAPAVETGFLNRTIVVEGVEYRYQVYVPREFQRSKLWPIIVSLHASDDFGNDGLRPTEPALGSEIRRHSEWFPTLAIFPQIHTDGMAGWHMQGGVATLAMLDKTIAEFNGDPSRVYLTGSSAGGNGVWFLASQHPERFAALAPVCGFVTEHNGGTAYPSIAPAGTPDLFAYVASRVAGIPVWIFHGGADNVISVEESRHMYAALKAAGADVQYTEFPGIGHDSWNWAFNREDLIVWMLKQRKK
jgi:predicted peptidase